MLAMMMHNGDVICVESIRLDGADVLYVSNGKEYRLSGSAVYMIRAWKD